MTSRELMMILRGLAGMNLVSGDVVEVAPAYDHAEITSLAAATVGLRDGLPDGGQDLAE